MLVLNFLGTLFQCIGWGFCAFFDKESKPWLIVDIILSILNFAFLPIDMIRIITNVHYSAGSSIFCFIVGVWICVWAYLKYKYPVWRMR